MTFSTPSLASLSVGDTLPPLSVNVSTRLIIGGALASRDFQDVHHDVERARALGSPDIFMNILTTNGLVGRFVTDWAGAQAQVRRINIKLGAPCYPGDTLIFSGEITRLDNSQGIVDIRVIGKNNLGQHVSGEVTVAFTTEVSA